MGSGVPIKHWKPWMNALIHSKCSEKGGQSFTEIHSEFWWWFYGKLSRPWELQGIADPGTTYSKAKAWSKPGVFLIWLQGWLPLIISQLPIKSHPPLHTTLFVHGAYSGWAATRAAQGQGPQHAARPRHDQNQADSWCDCMDHCPTPSPCTPPNPTPTSTLGFLAMGHIVGGVHQKCTGTGPTTCSKAQTWWVLYGLWIWLHGSLPPTFPQPPTKSHPPLHTRFWGHVAQSGWVATRAALGQGSGSRSPTRQLQGLETLPFNSEGSKTWGCPVVELGLAIWLGPCWGPAAWQPQNSLTPFNLHCASHCQHTSTPRPTPTPPTPPQCQ